MLSVSAWSLHTWTHIELLLADLAGCCLAETSHGKKCLEGTILAIGGKKQVKIIWKLESPSRQNRGEKCEWHISGLGPQAISRYLIGSYRHFVKNASCLQNKDIVMLSLVASTSSLVLEVLAACPMTESLRSPVSTTLQLITGVKLPIEEFDQICRPEVNTFDGNQFCFFCQLVFWSMFTPDILDIYPWKINNY